VLVGLTVFVRFLIVAADVRKFRHRDAADYDADVIVAEASDRLVYYDCCSVVSDNPMLYGTLTLSRLTA